MASSLLDRIEKKISFDESGCWLWTGTRDNGYGRIRAGRRMLQAPRAVYELLVEQIPVGLEIDHLCRNRACVNPDHLEPVTRLENVRRGTQGDWQKAKTHCPYGHEYTPENTMLQIQGAYTIRECRKCHRRRGRETARRRRAAF